MSATIGALPFELRGALVAPAPPVDGLALLETGDGVVRVVEDGRWRFLVLDHRRFPEDGILVRLEFWEPLQAGECGVNGAFVLCDPCPGAIPDPSAGTLHELAAQILGMPPAA